MTAGPAPLNDPCCGLARIRKVRGSASTSLPVSVMSRALSSSVVTACGFAIGGSFTAVTPISTIASFESASWSLALKEKLSGPL